MKKLIYISSLLLFLSFFATEKAHAQAVFNDTILFQIIKTRPTPNGAKYLMNYQTVNPNGENFTGKIILSMCQCYCDSIWDAWPKTPSDSIMAGGTATMSYFASSSGNNSPGPWATGGPNMGNGRLNIWQMPGSFSLTEAFTLPVTFTID
jgi:hypothetical protein